MHQQEINNKPLPEQVEKKILSYIKENNITVGSKIPNEFELAETFGVGRSTIREATKLLVSKNVLSVRRGAGTFVLNTEVIEDDPLGLSNIKDRHNLAMDLITVRIILEPEIAALAAEFATPENIEELTRQCDRVEEMIRKKEDHIEEDIKFHTCIAKCTQNAVIENLVPTIQSAVSLFANITHLQLREETIRTHRDITEAIARHDAIGAKCSMTVHMTYNRQMIMKIIQEENNKK